MTRGDLAASLDLAGELFETAQQQGDPAGLVAGQVAVAYTGLFLGADRDAVLGRLAIAAKAEQECEPSTLSRTPEHLGVSRRICAAIAHGLWGDTQAALAAGHEAVAYGRALRSDFQGAYCHMFASWAAAAVNRPDEAFDHADAALELCERARLSYLAQLTTPIHAWAAARRGASAVEQAERLASVIAFLEGAGQRHAVANYHLFLAEVRLLAGQRDQAAAALESGRALAEQIGETVYERQFERVERDVRDR